MIKIITKLAGSALALGALSITTHASATPSGALIINEWNAVSSSEMLDDCKDSPAQGDQFFGCQNGNGGNWIELIVTQNNLNIQGWTVAWKNNDSGGHPNNGSFTFSNDSLWASLKAGTIITVHDNGSAGYSTLYSGNPCSDHKWWIDVDVLNTTYIASSSLFFGTTLLGSGFKTDNDCWRGMIKDNASTVVQNWVGENTSCGSIPAAIWAGAGLGNLEVGKLEANPAGGTSDTNYKDGDSGTFGGPNAWTGGGPQSLDALCNNACGGSNGCCGTPGNYGCYTAAANHYYY